ncbi:hypothetical protein DDZ13_02820 [Coraliomargarita sinensis]|uniref:Uncharacterized protein n=1 Tax=Coraliomargarita sinensis TaxID=2174842 RepID=A0A317ZGZ4_9BACT|nr:hypothetical protein DDZ13_02820 [Coraliomargarita sinensis]
MNFDKPLARPIRVLLKPSLYALPASAACLIISRFLPYEYSEIVFPSAFAVFSCCIVLWTPYLIATGACFYMMSQLEFPMSLAIEEWSLHVLLLSVIAIMLWRTYRHWPFDKKKKGKTAPWWAFLLGGSAALGLFALMAYFLHYQDL